MRNNFRNYPGFLLVRYNLYHLYSSNQMILVNISLLQHKIIHCKTKLNKLVSMSNLKNLGFKESKRKQELEQSKGKSHS